MIIALIIIAIALQLLQWRFFKKCVDIYKLIAQEWRETAEALKDEITSRENLLATEMALFHKELSSIKKEQTKYVIHHKFC